MSDLTIHDLEQPVLERLYRLAAAHGRTPAVEAKAILEQALQPATATGWEQVNAIRHKLAAAGNAYCDSADSIREDRER